MLFCGHKFLFLFKAKFTLLKFVDEKKKQFNDIFRIYFCREEAKHPFTYSAHPIFEYRGTKCCMQSI